MATQQLFWSGNIRHLRLRKKMSQETLAEKLGISRVKLNAHESGRTVNPTVDDLVNASEFFKMSIDCLLKIDLSKLTEQKILELEARIKTLDDICSEINPYQTIPDELKMRLLDFNILNLDDPFKVTNSLLMLLEDTIDELHIIKPFDLESSTVKEIL